VLFICLSNRLYISTRSSQLLKKETQWPQYARGASFASCRHSCHVELCPSGISRWDSYNPACASWAFRNKTADFSAFLRFVSWSTVFDNVARRNGEVPTWRSKRRVWSTKRAYTGCRTLSRVPYEPVCQKEPGLSLPMEGVCFHIRNLVTPQLRTCRSHAGGHSSQVTY
jgi:hypothetical protein